jgi:hypothetical protein
LTSRKDIKQFQSALETIISQVNPSCKVRGGTSLAYLFQFAVSSLTLIQNYLMHVLEKLMKKGGFTTLTKKAVFVETLQKGIQSTFKPLLAKYALMGT